MTRPIDWRPVTDDAPDDSSVSCVECGLPLTDAEIELADRIQVESPLCARCLNRLFREFVEAVQDFTEAMQAFTGEGDSE